MTYWRILPLLLVAALVLPSCTGAQRGGTSDRINGLVTTVVDGEEVPVALAQVEVSIAGSDNLRGMFTTNDAGHFAMDRLADKITWAEQPLLRNQEYRIRIESAEHYIMKQLFTYGRGTEDWVFTLQSKDFMLSSESTPPPPPAGDGEGWLTFGGTVRRGR